MVTINLKTAPELKRVIQAVFPNYKKHTCFLSSFGSGKNINSYWDGGSRDEFGIVDLETMRSKSLPTQTHPFYDIARKGMANAETEAIAVDHRGNVTLKVLPENFALVEAGTFCGKPATAKIYVNEANLTKFINA